LETYQLCSDSVGLPDVSRRSERSDVGHFSHGHLTSLF
jgi:hypothetical protein